MLALGRDDGDVEETVLRGEGAVGGPAVADEERVAVDNGRQTGRYRAGFEIRVSNGVGLLTRIGVEELTTL